MNGRLGAVRCGVRMEGAAKSGFASRFSSPIFKFFNGRYVM